MSENVSRWRPAIRECRLKLGLSESSYDDATLLALIEVESAGDDSARRTTRVEVVEGSGEEAAFRACVVSKITRREEEGGTVILSGRVPSQFCGLLQMGRPAGIDAGFERAGFRGWDTTAALMGNGRAAIDAFLRYQERYSARHCYQPSRIALQWKGGPGTMSRVNASTKAGMPFNEAIREAEEALGVPNAFEYVQRFRVARERWAAWLEGQGEPAAICAPVKHEA